MRHLLFFVFLFVTLTSCKHFGKGEAPLFRIVPASKSGIYYSGQIQHAPIAGGGVAIGDINNDGLPDIFFAGDSFNTLYLNKGNLAFEDITVKAGLKGPRWSHGAAMADINNDGFLDIVVTREHNEPFSALTAGFVDTLNVLVYINNGNGTFTDKAKELGILTTGPLSHAVFLDINNDGFLDIYIDANYNSKLQSNALQNLSDWEPKDFYPDFLFLSDSGKRFTNIIKTSGITFNTKFRYGFTPFACDLNGDGKVDLYLNNDFDTPDHFYLNTGGKFEEAPYKTMMQTSLYTMGIDVADINNDGLLDVFTADMRSDKNYRQKTSWWESPYDWTRLLKEQQKHLEKQQVKNALQLNMGNGTFSQISELAGVDATEWSWSPLLADFDNDGNKDLFVSNGNIIDHAFNVDLPYEMDSIRHANPKFSVEEYYNFIKAQKDNPWFVNYIFKNNGDLTFKNMQQQWGMGDAVNTNGAAYADLDNDGDIDLVVNNNGSMSFIYENLRNQQPGMNYLRVTAIDEQHKPTQGTTAMLYKGGNKQLAILQPVKGFLSTSESMLHFGTGANTKMDSLVVTWPDGATQTLKEVACNQTLKVFHKNAARIQVTPALASTLLEKQNSTGLDYKHEEDDFIDFGVDPLLPQMYSKFGPALAKGDINGDGLEDVLVGGSVNKPRACFIQTKDGHFKRTTNTITNEMQYEDGAILLFDADGDGDNDVYIATGGYEHAEASDSMQHRLYINDGKGNFTKATGAIPDIRTSSVCAIAYDFDNDGDLDLFVGGRVTAQNYPNIPKSYLLRNDKGHFTDVTDAVAPGLKQIGMVTDAVWTDFDGDGKTDLLLVGEYMAPTFFKNSGGKFSNVSANIVLNEKANGMWNYITPVDIDKDGDMDYVLGNLGLNTRFKAQQDAPLEMYAADFDHNGSMDILAGYYEDGKLFPCKQLRTLTPRINGLAKKYHKAIDYGNAAISDLFGPEPLQKALHLLAYETASCILRNDGNNHFTIVRLPVEAQFAPVNGILAEDVNHDGNMDLLLVGNFYYAEVERGRYDAFKGLCLLGNGKGGFVSQTIAKSGFVVDGDGRKIVKVKTPSGQLYVASQNNDSLVVYGLATHPSSVTSK